MAVVGEGPWINPFTGIEETISGVYCSCYDCDNYSFTMDTRSPGSIFMTKLEYKEHLNERRRAYYARKSLQATKNGMARTKEKTEAEAVWEGRPVPTFFDINGDWLSPDEPNDQYLHSRYFKRMLQP